MSTAVLVPFRGGCEHRERNLGHILNHYELHHGWPIHVADSEGRWSKGHAVAAALAETDGDVLVLADADSFTDPDTIGEAVRLVGDGEASWVVPHRTVYRLSFGATRAFFEGHPPSRKHLARRPYDAVWGGGITVIARDVYEQVPVDGRFYDWGGEDFAWAWALRTLVGDPVQLDGDLFHLWHPHPSPNYDKPPESEALARDYIDAKYHPAMMRAVVAGAPYTPPEPLETVRRFRSATTPRTVRCGPHKARFVDHVYVTSDPDMAEAVARFRNVEEITE